MTADRETGGVQSPPPGHPTHELARQILYSPDLDGAADPGEIVWTWVPYEDRADKGKDRPVLVVGRDIDDADRSHLLGLMLSSKDWHREDPDWISLGTGVWDSWHRESFVRLDRVLMVAEHGIRREGAILDQNRFEVVATRLRTDFGWR
ncbi:type II toxin-antitoxin system PemK/MazF family toxin [Gordonia sp. SL306]|uniref:type II toxin-antitoxin system PemK/MazF family toxin n=1 Tax=Gordonia sp. SL306 TaxID=2995145 RepID=UPI0022704923|nr:type II toxin-antitoxin system PemK/MazF family toxin [Gordonia sp. SL306]WAC56004.1 type II toxin-antitoxin system PemK/MazF family toxin [Gordonia sp. SL306]